MADPEKDWIVPNEPVPEDFFRHAVKHVIECYRIDALPTTLDISVLDWFLHRGLLSTKSTERRLKKEIENLRLLVASLAKTADDLEKKLISKEKSHG